MNNQDSTSPRYMEVTSDGKILRQSDTIPSDVQVSYLNSQGSTNNYNSTYSNAHWSNYPYQTSNNKNRWPNNGQFNPYRTTYQDYGPNNHKTLVPNVLYTRADLYRQVSNLNNGFAANIINVTDTPTISQLAFMWNLTDRAWPSELEVWSPDRLGPKQKILIFDQIAQTIGFIKGFIWIRTMSTIDLHCLVRFPPT